MRRETISIPVSVELTNESSWEKLDKKGTSFFVVRFHFQLNQEILDEPHKVGDYVGFYQSTKGMSAQHVESETINIERIISSKSIEKYFTESEILGEIASDLVTNIELPKILKIGSSVKSRVSTKFRDTYKLETEIQDSHKITSSHTLEITNHYPAKETKAIVSAPVYRRRRMDIYLSYIDYLKVNYRRTPFGLRKKSKSHPPVSHPKKHSNVFKVGQPIATAYYWELMETASKFMYETEHETQVKDPSQITICAAQSTQEKYVEFPDVPTLYQIARAAFPHKWIWRKSEQNDWNEEDLKNIELEEVKALKNGWYRLHGKINNR